MRVQWLSLAVASSLALAPAARSATDDASFVAEAASGGMMEVALGTLAEKQASDPGVKAFGRHMVQDHTQVNESLRDVAAGAGLAVPRDMNAEHRATVQELSALEGEAFDRRYTELMVEDHEKDVAAFREQASSGDSVIDLWARETLPTLERHLEMARAIADGHGGVSPGD
jgi:putative membrane protein